MQDPIQTIQEQYQDTATTDTPVLKSELEELFDRVVALRKHINALTEKQNALRPRTLTNIPGEDGQPLDAVELAVELAVEQEQENTRVERLWNKYAAAIAEKEKERDATQNQAEVLKQRKLDIEHRIQSLKNGVMDAHLDLVEEARNKSENELAMHNAALKDNPTNLQRIVAKRGKRTAESQIRGQIQKKADLERVIPELEAMLSYIEGDFEGQRKLQKQLEKQNLQLVEDLERYESTNGDSERPTYVEFLQSWGGYREGMYQMVASLSEEISADLVDANIAQYVAVQHTNAADTLAARQSGTGNIPML